MATASLAHLPTPWDPGNHGAAELIAEKRAGGDPECHRCLPDFGFLAPPFDDDRAGICCARRLDYSRLPVRRHMPGSPIQAVFFDLDGTLLDHTAAARAGAIGLFRTYSDRLTDSDEHLLQRWEDLMDLHFDRYLRGETTYAGQRRGRVRDFFDVTPSAMPDAEADAAFAVYRDSYERHWMLFPDVTDTLDALRGWRLGVITNGSSTHQRQKLAAVGVLDRFAAVVVSEDVGVAKPDPVIFQAACQAVGEPPSACVLVGDRLDVDALGACEAGLRGVWLDRHDEGPGSSGVTRITRLTELPALVSEP